MHERSVQFSVNGNSVAASVEPRMTLADFLRDKCGLTGTHLGCEHGACGACTVLLDGAAVRSCLLFAVQADGMEVTTVEGVASPAASFRRCNRRCGSAMDCNAAFARPVSSCRLPRS
ncbi:2Fe-2S iron-sulfur cluster binding domain protein [Mycobacterium kansasii]|uniref:2Fe-2S iron-sulfur cluster binding domain protein n=1 Tax=Mycobacterium kansasii TaxID=1768 RepID=A0A1V3WPQ2_MYCKA|nr:2Fe-2S iron-sulfur cluster binding domain protein [Mycobacterium kansasii]